jgi:hypothetical protein
MFGRMYEDPAAELGVFPAGGRVLAIASAGDTAAALARAGHRVTAVDISATQLAYAEARLAGAPTSTGTAERLQAVARRAAAAVEPGWRPAAMTTFLQLSDLRAQHEHWHRHLDRPRLAALMQLAFASAGLVRRDLWRALPPRMDLALRRRLATGLTSHPNATNPWAWRLLLGRECPSAPPETPVTDPVDWVHDDVVKHLWSVPRGWYDAATLSNVLDGPPPAFAAALRDALHHGVRAGGPVVLRTFRDTPPLPGDPLPDRSLLWGAVVRLHPPTPGGRLTPPTAGGRLTPSTAGRRGHSLAADGRPHPFAADSWPDPFAAGDLPRLAADGRTDPPTAGTLSPTAGDLPHLAAGGRPDPSTAGGVPYLAAGGRPDPPTAGGVPYPLSPNDRPDLLAASGRPDPPTAGGRPDSLGPNDRPDPLTAGGRPDPLTAGA